MPPSEKELREACDTMQALIISPLPPPRQRAEMFRRVYQVLRQLLPDQVAGEVREPSDDPEIDLADDPVLGFILER